MLFALSLVDVHYLLKYTPHICQVDYLRGLITLESLVVLCLVINMTL